MTKCKLDELFEMQSKLNDATFLKHGITDNFGAGLKMDVLHRIGRDIENLGPNTEINEWLTKYSMALKKEVQELEEELLEKWWSKDLLDMQNIRVEIIDQLHFWISLALTAGLDSNEVLRIYKQKNEVNLKRLETGYNKSTKTEEDNRGIK